MSKYTINTGSLKNHQLRALAFDLKLAWNHAKIKHGFLATQTDWTTAIDPESMTELKELYELNKKELTHNALAYRIIKLYES